MTSSVRLSKAQRQAVRLAWTDTDGALRVDSTVCAPQTRKALERRGIVEEWSYVLTDLGRSLFEEL
jgi:hypothetical protein